MAQPPFDNTDCTFLVAGADGFIGSHLVEHLAQHKAKVRALSLYNSFNSWGWLDACELSGQVEVWSGDIRDPHFCYELLEGIDIAINLAALIAIPYSYKAPHSYIDTNVKGTVNLCHAGLKHGVKRFIQTSTSEVYGSARYTPIDESHPLTPQSPYSASKISSDAMAMSYYYSFGLPVTIARPFNTYGPRQSARAIIPTIISQIQAGHSSLALGDLTPTRDFNFVDDTCRGIISLCTSEKTIGEIYNVGSGQEISIGDLVELISSLMQKKIEVVQDEQRLRPKNSEVTRLVCDNKKIAQATGHKARVSLEEGLHKTIKWFQNPDNLGRYKTDIYNV